MSLPNHMELQVHNQEGKATGTVTLNDGIFGIPVKKDLIYRIVTSQMSNRRQTLAHAKTRSEVRGGGKKPWQQKGTGRARHGSIRSPIWKGGGVTHGPSKDANFKKKVNIAQGRLALLSALSERIRAHQVLVVDDIVSDGKTKAVAAVFAKLAPSFDSAKVPARVASRFLVVVPSVTASAPLRKATQNLANVDVVPASDLNALTVLAYPFIVMFKDSLAVIEKTFAK